MLSPYETDQDYSIPYAYQEQEKPPEINWSAVVSNAVIATSATQVVVFLARHNSGLQPFAGVLLLAALGGSLMLSFTAKNGYMRFFALMGFGCFSVGLFSAVWDFIVLIFSDFSGYFLPYQLGVGLLGMVLGYVVVKLLTRRNEQYF